MTKWQTFLWSLMVLIFPSCDCYVSVEGIVLTSTDKLPIEGASVEMIGRNKTTKTDKNGYFHIWEQTGFCFNPHIKITANNYKPFEITVKGSSDTRSYEIKSESESFEYDKPIYPYPNDRQTFITGGWIEKYSGKFSIISDTTTFFLDTIDVKGEIERIKARLKNSNGMNK